MIPVPEYLKQYASENKQKGNSLSFKLKCTCGCESFTIFEKDYTDNEKQLITQYENKIPDTGSHPIYGGIDSDGNPYSYIKILGIFKKHIEFPQPPGFMWIDVIKAVCSHCQSEIVLFDNRCYGYDGMTVDNEVEKNYICHFRQRDNTSYGIWITVENEPSLEEFNEMMNQQCSLEFYSNSYSRIRIHGFDENGKKKLLYGFETA
ncbi:MAG: hypothetical protein IJB24_03190 [Clostridia bacterium]|nr:hypothetical protein [Clostridia bacterium]